MPPSVSLSLSLSLCVCVCCRMLVPFTWHENENSLLHRSKLYSYHPRDLFLCSAALFVRIFDPFLSGLSEILSGARRRSRCSKTKPGTRSQRKTRPEGHQNRPVPRASPKYFAQLPCHRAPLRSGAEDDRGIYYQ